MEGSGSYGSGACAHLGAAREQVIEFSHPRTAATSDGAKTDALDARRAAREVLGRSDLAVPRARGRREALRALESTRRGAQTARTAAINELKALIISAPVDLRDQLRGLTTAAQVAKCAALRLPAAPLDELTPPNRPCAASRGGSRPSANEHPRASKPSPARPARRCHRRAVAWSHRNEAAFARLAGVAPLEASSGQNTRPQPPRRPPTQAHHRRHPQPTAPTPRPTSPNEPPKAKPPEKPRCLKRYIARRSTASSNTPKSTLDKHRSIVSAKAQMMACPAAVHPATSLARNQSSSGRTNSRADCPGRRHDPLAGGA